MIYLSAFSLPGEEKENAFFDPSGPLFKTKNYRTAYQTKYPFGLFKYRDLPELVFDEITILCGNNGSGKSTILNVIAEKLELSRDSRFNRSDFFNDYTELCEYDLENDLPLGSAIITSDDVFEKMQDLRHLNDGIDRERERLIDEYVSLRRLDNDDDAFKLHGIDDYDRFKRIAQMRSKNESQSNMLRRRLIKNIREQSNGESALDFFVNKIERNALYLLDEPENSLSPANQIKLKYFIEDCARRHDCQFILSTHSPFMLSLRHAKIYDLDDEPPRVKNWTELENVRTYREFFLEHEEEF